MSYFVFYCKLFICKLQLTNYPSCGRERPNLSAIVYLHLCGFCSKRFRLPLSALDVALPGPSI